MAAVGAGILWLGWNGFNGGDPYFAGADASLAVHQHQPRHRRRAADLGALGHVFASKQRKPTFLGAVNGMITGLVAITPAAGYVNSFGAMHHRLIASSLVWMSWNWLGKTRTLPEGRRRPGRLPHPRRRRAWPVACSSGCSPTRNIIVYLGGGSTGPTSPTPDWLYGHHPKQLLDPAGAAATVIVWDALITFIILRVLGLFMKLRLPDEVLETGDLGVHDEEAYPDDTLVTGRRIEGVGGASKQAESIEE